MQTKCGGNVLKVIESVNGSKNKYSPENVYSYCQGNNKKWTSIGTVRNLCGQGHKFVLPPCTVRRMIGKTKTLKDHCW